MYVYIYIYIYIHRGAVTVGLAFSGLRSLLRARSVCMHRCTLRCFRSIIVIIISNMIIIITIQ